MEGLVIRKDLLNYAQSRSYYASKLCFVIMHIYAYTVGVDIYKIPDSLVLGPSVAIGAMPTYYKGLAQASYNISKLIVKINDDEILDEVFAKNLRINGSMHDLSDKSIRYGTSFEAVDLLVTASRLLIVSNYWSTGARPICEFLRWNAENDFLAQNQYITALFQRSVNNQRRNLKDFIMVCLVLTPFLLGGVGLLLAAIIWRQYSEEAAYLRAFTKLDPGAIKSILKGMELFRSALLHDSSFTDQSMIEYFWDSSVWMENSSLKQRHAKHDTQEIDYDKLRRRYLGYVVQVTGFVGVLIAIPLWNFLTARSYTDIIYNRQSQLQLSNHLSETVALSYQGLAELFETNNTFSFIQMSPYNYMKKNVAELKNLQNQIIKGLMELNNTYDPQIQTLLFEGRPCSSYTSFYFTYCNTLNNQGTKTNIFNLIAYYAGAVEDRLNKYDYVNLTTMTSIMTAFYQGINPFSVTSSFLSYQAQQINLIVSDNLTNSILSAKNIQNTILTIFGVLLTIVSLLIWIRILKTIKEVRNDFKRVLQVLPPKLVLSSFLLKQFLVKASGMIHDTS